MNLIGCRQKLDKMLIQLIANSSAALRSAVKTILCLWTIQMKPANRSQNNRTHVTDSHFMDTRNLCVYIIPTNTEFIQITLWDEQTVILIGLKDSNRQSILATEETEPWICGSRKNAFFHRKLLFKHLSEIIHLSICLYFKIFKWITRIV